MLGWVLLYVLSGTYPSDSDALTYCIQNNSRYGEELVRACAESGTHLVDITGEVLWVHDMMQR